MIAEFQGANRFLSNFWVCPVVIDGIAYPSTEAAFQSFKTTDLSLREEFALMTPVEAKRRGRTIDMRPNWDEVRVAVMFRVVLAKFTQNEDLHALLLGTGKQTLVEGNGWGDRYWGVCDGVGKNVLGIILMTVRELLKAGA